MFRKSKIWLALLPTLMSSVLLFSACVGSSQQNTQGESRSYPTVLITPLITQIVATRPAPTATPEGESTPEQVIAASWDPFAVQIYFPIRGCVASRLHVGDPAFVAYNSGKMAVYSTNDISYAPLVRRAQVGEAFLVVEGPWCEDGILVWKVRSTDKDENDVFVPEGNGEQYWLLPLQTNPGIPTPKATQQADLYQVILVMPKGCGRR